MFDVILYIWRFYVIPTLPNDRSTAGKDVLSLQTLHKATFKNVLLHPLFFPPTMYPVQAIEAVAASKFNLHTDSSLLVFLQE